MPISAKELRLALDAANVRMENATPEELRADQLRRSPPKKDPNDWQFNYIEEERQAREKP